MRTRALVLAIAAGSLASIASGQATFQVLGSLLPGNQGGSNALGISPDGSTVVGSAASPNGSEAFRWRSSTGMQGLGLPTTWFPDCDCSGFASEATAASGNGDVVSVNVIETENGNLKAGRWTAADGIVDLSEPDRMGARDISTDGATIIGELYTSGGAANGYIWNSEGGLQQITFPDVQRLAWGCSADGTVIAGQAGAFPGQAFRWTAMDGVELLGDIPGGPNDSGANAISLDGNVVVGFGSDSDNTNTKFQAARWTRDTGYVGIGRVPGRNLSSAFATNADGTVVVGNAFGGGSGVGFIWTPNAGIADLNVVLQQQGVADFGGYRIISAQGVSADGLTIVGTAMNAQFDQKAYVARLASIPGAGCNADINGDGNVDQGDVDCMIAIVAGDTSCGYAALDPDFSGDGNVDQGDVDAVINVVAGGNCP